VTTNYPKPIDPLPGNGERERRSMKYHIKAYCLAGLFLGGIALTGCESAYFPLPNIIGLGMVAFVGIISIK